MILAAQAANELASPLPLAGYNLLEITGICGNAWEAKRGHVAEKVERLY